MAVGQLSHARDGFVDGLVDLEVLPLQIGAALPAVVEPDEEDPAVVRRAFPTRTLPASILDPASPEPAPPEAW